MKENFVEKIWNKTLKRQEKSFDWVFKNLNEYIFDERPFNLFAFSLLDKILNSKNGKKYFLNSFEDIRLLIDVFDAYREQKNNKKEKYLIDNFFRHYFYPSTERLITTLVQFHEIEWENQNGSETIKLCGNQVSSRDLKNRGLW